MRKIFQVRFVLFILCVSGMIVSAQGSAPADTVTAFLTAWGEDNTQAMYDLLCLESQNEFPLEVFQNRYKVVYDAVGLTGLTFTVQPAQIQGVTAAVAYDVALQSDTFGEIEDPGRVMRLVRDGEGWCVAWSSLDIFNVLASEARITSGGALPPRANIYDRNGNPIAEEGSITAVYTQKQNIPNEEACTDLLVALTRRSRVYYRTLFAGYVPETIFLLTELNTDVYAANSNNLSSICGVNRTFERTARRYYGNNAMGHVTGYVGFMQTEQQQQFLRRGYEVGDLIGQYGIEKAYEQTLAGVPERVLRISEPGGYVLRELGGATGAPSTPVQLTIDRDLQLATAQAFTDAYNYAVGNWAGIAGGGAAVILDVKTGAILAMVSYPLIDPMLFDPSSYLASAYGTNLIGQLNSDPRFPLNNHAIQDQYAPGSVYKIITAAAVLNEEIATPDIQFDCPLRWEGITFGDTLASRADWRETDGLPAAGIISPAQAIMSSCNPFFWQYGALLFRARGSDGLRSYARQMGLGERFNLNLGVPEAAGNLDNPIAADVAINDSVGQGNIQVPPIQMAVATMAVANGGTVYKPYIVQQIGGFDGVDVQSSTEPQVLSTLDFKDGVMQTLRQGMCGATTDENLGTAFLVFGDAPYSVCGKTGTAQAGQYPNAWFIAYAPADDPQIAMVVMVANAGREGSEVAAPITRRILDYYFRTEVKPFPEWWGNEPFTPLNIPEGGGVG